VTRTLPKKETLRRGGEGFFLFYGPIIFGAKGENDCAREMHVRSANVGSKNFSSTHPTKKACGFLLALLDRLFGLLDDFLGLLCCHSASTSFLQ
jgi:hypothetical protein